MRDDEYFAIKARAAAVFKKIPNVTAIGMGGRERDGRPTGEIVIKVFVNRKKSLHEVPPGELIPSHFEGVPTDVVEMGLPVPNLDPVPGGSFPPPPDVEMGRTEPLRGGVFISMGMGGNGSIGCFLRDKNDGTVYALTNAHVVADPSGKVLLSRRVMRAGDLGGVDSPPIGYVAAFAHKDPFDCAVFRLEAGMNWLPVIRDLGTLKGTYEVTLADSVTQLYNVRKRGARTLVTGGILIALAVETSEETFRGMGLDFLVRANPPPNQTGRSCFSAGGDSGSVLINDDDEVIGLLWGSIDMTKASIQQGITFANPIGAVLEHFQKVHHLDLEVATPSDPDPLATQTAIPPAGAPVRPLPDVQKDRDGGHHRPLVGGSQILGKPFGAANSATLGCVVTKTNDQNTAYILTSFDRLSAGGQIPPTDVGQPDNTGSCSACCRNTVGEFTKRTAGLAAPSVALAKLEKDQTWRREVMQIGWLGGTASVTADQITSGKYQVRKRGIGTRLTGGIVIAVGGVAGELPTDVADRDANAMLVRPNPNRLKPNTDICFSTPFDRGAVVVNENNEVVGLLYGEKEIVVNGVKIVHGVAAPFELVLAALNSVQDNIKVEFKQLGWEDKSFVTKALAITEHDSAVPPLVGDQQPAPHDLGAALDWLRSELSHSVAGRLVIDLWSTHRGEIQDLIEGNRKVATVWHRSGGPALLHAFTRAVHTPSTIIPASVNGLPTTTCLDRMAAAFKRHGSPSLHTDISRLASTLPAIGGLSLAEILTELAMTREPVLNH